MSDQPSHERDDPADWLTTPSPTDSQRASEDSAVLGLLRGDAPPADLVRIFLPPSRKAGRADWLAAEAAARQWFALGFTTDDARMWLAVGVEPDESDLASALIDEGLTPELCREALATNPRTGERTSIVDIARWYLHDPYMELPAALDAAGVARERTPWQSGLRWDAHRRAHPYRGARPIPRPPSHGPRGTQAQRTP